MERELIRERTLDGRRPPPGRPGPAGPRRAGDRYRRAPRGGASGAVPDRLSLWISAAIVVSVVVLAGLVVAMLSPVSPAVIAKVLTALAGFLAAMPPVIRAVRGQHRQGRRR